MAKEDLQMNHEYGIIEKYKFSDTVIFRFFQEKRQMRHRFNRAEARVKMYKNVLEGKRT